MQINNHDVKIHVPSFLRKIFPKEVKHVSQNEAPWTKKWGFKYRPSALEGSGGTGTSETAVFTHVLTGEQQHQIISNPAPEVSVPPESQPLEDRFGDPIDRPLQVRSEAAKAKPLSEVIAKRWPSADLEIWKDIEREYPVGSRCFSRLLQLMGKTAEYQTATPVEKSEYAQNIGNTCQSMQENWTNEKTSQLPEFVHFMMNLSKKSLCSDDSIIFNRLSPMYWQMRPCNFSLIHPFNQEFRATTYERKTGTSLLSTSFCLAASVHWLASVLKGQEFKCGDQVIKKFSDLQHVHNQEFNAVKEREQQAARGAYEAANHAAVEQGLPPPDPKPFVQPLKDALSEASTTAIRKLFDDAAGDEASACPRKFTVGDAQQAERVEFISSAGIQRIENLAHPIASFFSGIDLRNIDGCELSFDKLSGDGKTCGAHSIAIKGGETPMIYDANLGVYMYEGTDIGGDLEAYLHQMYKPEGGALRPYFNLVSMRDTDGP